MIVRGLRHLEYDVKDLLRAKETGEYDLERLVKIGSSSKIFWASPIGYVGTLLFSFDNKKFYSLFGDFPYKLTKEQIDFFVKEEPYWANFFRKRLEDMKQQEAKDE